MADLHLCPAASQTWLTVILAQQPAKHGWPSSLPNSQPNVADLHPCPTASQTWRTFILAQQPAKHGWPSSLHGSQPKMSNLHHCPAAKNVWPASLPSSQKCLTFILARQPNMAGLHPCPAVKHGWPTSWPSSKAWLTFILAHPPNMTDLHPCPAAKRKPTNQQTERILANELMQIRSGAPISWSLVCPKRDQWHKPISHFLIAFAKRLTPMIHASVFPNHSLPIKWVFLRINKYRICTATQGIDACIPCCVVYWIPYDR